MTIIDGKEVAAKLRKEIAAEVEAWVASGHRAPHLVAILVGNDGASQTYVGHKEKCCAEVGLPFDGAAPRRSDQRSLPARRNRQTEQRSRRGRIHRTIAPAETHLGTKSDRSD